MVRNTKIIVLMCLLVLLFSLSTVWAGGKQEDSAGEETITLKFWNAGTETIWHDYWISVTQRFKAKHPNIEFEIAEAPFGNEIESKLNVAFASGTSPDVINHGIISIAERAEKGHFLPLDDYLDSYEDKDDIIDGILYDFPEYKGKRYGLMFYPVPEPYVYRKDFFREAGLDPDNPPSTWAELAAAAEKLVVRDGDTVIRSGMSIPYDGFKLAVVFARMNNAQIHDAEGNPVFDNPEMVETIDYIADLFRKNLTLEVTFQQERTMSSFFQGKSAMGWSYPSMIMKAIKDDPTFEEKMGFMTIKQKQPAAWCGAAYLFMSSESKHKDEAWEFMKFFWDKDEMWTRYKETGCPPVRKSLKDKYLQDNPYLNEPLWAAIADGVGAPKVTWSNLFLFKYLPQAEQETFFGKKTAKQALSDAAQELKDELALTK